MIKIRHITLIAGARPNFMKIAPIIHAIKKARFAGNELEYRLVHTGQHYDQKMSETFFEELDIPTPDANLGAGGGSQAEQTAAIMIAFERYLMANPTDLVLVVGDVTSTLACSIVAKKLNTKVAHIEAGIRSLDLTMPEEINRMVTDSITDLFFTTTELANNNLRKAGIPDDRIFFVGNVMIDTLLANRHRFKKPEIWDKFGLQKKQYLVMTMHRPANVDETDKLSAFIQAITGNVNNYPVIFPIHPRTANILKESGINESNLFVIDPLGYLEFNFLVENSFAVITDSGGITEETTVMGIPCLTLRDNTERPETVEIGTNMLVGTNPDNIKPALDLLFSNKWKPGNIPELWDGKAAERIVGHLIEILN
jgi:UDP-N-acetylglucosamine 2-epimerase (non-hydrolysing)